MPATTSRVRTSICPENVPGTMVANPVFQILRLNTDGLSNKPKTKTSGEKRSDRIQSDLAIVGKDVGGNLDIEFTKKTADQIIAEAMASNWTTSFEVSGAQITSVAAAGVYNFAGGVVVPIGTYVKVTGITNALNNGFFKVTASVGGQITTDNAASVIDAAPAATSRIKAVGFKAAANGDTQAIAGNKIQTALNPATFGLVPGMWFKALNFTGTQANNDWYRASSITGAGPYVIACDVVPTGFAVDAAAGQKVVLAFTDYLRNGSTRLAHSTERAFLDAGGGAIYDYRLGDQTDQLTITLPDQDIVTMSATFKGMDTIPPSNVQAVGATYLPAGTTPVVNTSTGLQRIAEALTRLNGGTSNLPLEIKFMLKNNLRDQPAAGQIGLAGIGFGDFEATGSLQVYLDTPAFLAKLWSNTLTSIDARFADANGDGLIVDYPAVKLEDGDPQGGGKNNDVTPTLAFRAQATTPTAGNQYAVHMQKFEAVA